MRRRRFRTLCVVLFVQSAGGAWSDPDKTKSGETDTTIVAANDLDILITRGVVRCPEADRSPEPTDPATTSALPGAARFVARDHFRETVSSRGSVQISWIGAMFSRRFLSKTEESDSGAFLRKFEVGKSARDAEIIAELNIHHETKLADLWCLLSAQPNGEPGVLFTNAVPNVFYIRDSAGNLLAVDAVWGGRGWEIGASAIDGPSLWLPGRQVIAR